MNVCVLVYCFRLESVRKDVECCFGRLKKRFRILRLPFLFVYEAQIHDTFKTAAILHNWLLDLDGLSDIGQDPTDWKLMGRGSEEQMGDAAETTDEDLADDHDSRQLDARIKQSQMVCAGIYAVNNHDLHIIVSYDDLYLLILTSRLFVFCQAMPISAARAVSDGLVPPPQTTALLAPSTDLSGVGLIEVQQETQEGYEDFRDMLVEHYASSTRRYWLKTAKEIYS